MGEDESAWCCSRSAMMAKDPLPDLNVIDAVGNPAVVGLGAQTGIKIKMPLGIVV